MAIGHRHLNSPRSCGPRPRGAPRDERRWRDMPVIEPRLLPPTEPAGDVLATGTPGSPGVAEGPVRIVRDAAAFGTLQPDEVLVAPYTNPAWTPLFGRAAAVVVDAGSAASHAAIVAREYGIPAVMGTGDATRRLTDGQRVRVDGTRGVGWLEGVEGVKGVALRSGGEGARRILPSVFLSSTPFTPFTP